MLAMSNGNGDDMQHERPLCHHNFLFSGYKIIFKTSMYQMIKTLSKKKKLPNLIIIIKIIKDWKKKSSK